MDLGSFCPLTRLRRSPWLGRAAVMGAALAAACGGASEGGVTGPGGAPPALAVVRVSLAFDTIQVGQTVAASASGLDQNGAAIALGVPVWSTVSPAVATVSTGGVVSALSPGRTMVTATVNGREGQVPLTVVLVPVARVAVSPGEARLVRGSTVQLSAVALDFSGHALPGRTISWTSADPSIATVTPAGVVTALSPGSATIVATSEGMRTSATITVTASADLVASITLTPATGTLTVGGTVQLAAVLKDAAGNPLTGRTVTWSVSVIAGAAVATVSATGLVTAMAPGSVIVEAFCEGQHGAATITVTDNTDASIVVTFAIPVANELVGDTLRVVVGVNTLYPVASVVAIVGRLGKPLSLTFARVGALGNAYLWIGLIDITDLPMGSYEVTATATDSRGARGVGTRQFQRDARKDKGGSSGQPAQK